MMNKEVKNIMDNAVYSFRAFQMALSALEKQTPQLASVEVGAEYIHFKGGHYIVDCIAKHTETGEEMVVYSGVSDGRIWVRPYDMFTDGRFQKAEGDQT